MSAKPILHLRVQPVLPDGGAPHRTSDALTQSRQVRRDSLEVIESACRTIQRARRLIDRSAALALETQMKCGIRPRPGGIVERLLDPGNDTPGDSGSFTPSHK